MEKASSAFRTISEVAAELNIPKHVLRFWEGKFPQLRPMKLGGRRRYYRPEDIDLLRGIQTLLYSDGYTIKGVQRILKGNGVRFVKDYWREDGPQANAKPGMNIPNLAEEAASEARREKGSLSQSAKSQKSSGQKAGGNSGNKTPRPAHAAPETVLPPVSTELREMLTKLLGELEECRKLLREHRSRPTTTKSSHGVRASRAK
ncbi:MAG: MerR family transcriptional regulator [Alphaproteobacteria bacterium]